MNTKKRPLIIGDSHGIHMARAFGELNVPKAWRERPLYPIEITSSDGVTAPVDLFPINPAGGIFESDGIQLWMNPNIENYLSSNREKWKYLLVSFEGNVHNIHFFKKLCPEIDFFDPSMPNKFIEGAQIVPRDSIINHLRSTLDIVNSRINIVKNVFDSIPIYFVQPPPPIPSTAHICRNPEGFILDESTVADKFFRLKVYRIYIQTLRAISEENGINFLEAPTACVDADGFLLQHYWNESTHAQPAYYHHISREEFLR